MELLAQHAVDELNSEVTRSGLASVSNNGVDTAQFQDPITLAISGNGPESDREDTYASDDDDDDELNEDSLEKKSGSVSASDGAPSKKRKNKSVYKGVFKCGKKFKAQIQTCGVQHYLGLYDTEEEAARAYDNHARLVLGTRAKTNFPYDFRDVVPAPFLPLPPMPLAKLNKSASEDDGKPSKRSYIGIKSRKRTRDTMNALLNDAVTATPALRYMNDLSPNSARNVVNSNMPSLVKPSNNILGHTLIHLPLGLSQSPFLVNQLPAGYTAMMHPSAISGGINSAITSSIPTLPSRNTLSQETSQGIDWSKQAYTPLEITNAFPYTAVSLTQAEPDWREQIYYWVGKLSYDDRQQCLRWRGKWMGSFSGKPAQSEFDSSSNDFSYCSPKIEKSKVFSLEGFLRPVTGQYTGEYSMDNDGSGTTEMYTDKELMVEFEELAKNPYPRYFVYGRGDSEFGAFVVHGIYDSLNRLLEMNRQYIADNDIQRDMSMMQLKQHLKRKTL